MTKVKICGITNLADARLAAKFGADALGFNFYEKSPRFISPEQARAIADELPAKILKVGVFVNESLERIVEIAAAAKLDALQLHGEETPAFARELKQITNLEIIKAFRVSPEFKPEDVLKYEADAILLDAFNPREHGGTGETFDWEIARKVQKIFPRMYLAGGLSNENIGLAISHVKPSAVDVCSGVEKAKGEKDEIKVINFLSKTKYESAGNKFYDFLNLVQKRPQMFLGKKSFSLFLTYLYGVKMGLELANSDGGERRFFLDFNGWTIHKFTGGGESEKEWSGIILEQNKNDEEKAFDHFFALLEEFKAENER